MILFSFSNIGPTDSSQVLDSIYQTVVAYNAGDDRVKVMNRGSIKSYSFGELHKLKKILNLQYSAWTRL